MDRRTFGAIDTPYVYSMTPTGSFNGDVDRLRRSHFAALDQQPESASADGVQAVAMQDPAGRSLEELSCR